MTDEIMYRNCKPDPLEVLAFELSLESKNENLLCLYKSKNVYEECKNCSGISSVMICKNYINKQHIKDFEKYRITNDK